ncbi:MAG: DUF1887 family protein [Clostridia bacterium]|nr:DUF1887 family protein [Clostridia bacterium]
METLVELYDERPLENVLSVQVFRPSRVVYVCPKDVARDGRSQKVIKDYLRFIKYRGEIRFCQADMFSTKDVLRALREICAKYPSPVLDITGGTDQALFAGGILSGETHIPSFTYSRRSNKFFSINDAPFGEELPCEISLKVEDGFVMAGGAVKKGRVDNNVLGKYMNLYEPFFDFYMRWKRVWTSIINWMQRASASNGGAVSLYVDAPVSLRCDHGMVRMDTEALRELEQLGMIERLNLEDRERVEFSFKDEQVRFWLRDVGSVLETMVYKKCLDTGAFDDVCTSVVVDWQGDLKQGNITNELDVMATKGIMPVFISCKTCQIRTEALNELAVLRDRFGGQIAKAAIVSSSKCQAITRHRAQELGISVIDLDDLKNGRLEHRLTALAQRPV